MPGGLTPSDVPQMVTITFDDAINDENWRIINRLFKESRKNPNGCPVLILYNEGYFLILKCNIMIFFFK